MLNKKSLFGLGFISFVLLFCGLLYGQTTGSISGTVTDATGAPVGGAKVTVTVPATGISREAATDSNGHYVAPLLGAATYIVKIEQSGFQTSEAKDVRLQVDEHR